MFTPTMCYISGVLCHVSCITCYVLHVNCNFSSFFSDKVVELVGEGSVINTAYPFQFSKNPFHNYALFSLAEIRKEDRQTVGATGPRDRVYKAGRPTALSFFTETPEQTHHGSHQGPHTINTQEFSTVTNFPNNCFSFKWETLCMFL